MQTETKEWQFDLDEEFGKISYATVITVSEGNGRRDAFSVDVQCFSFRVHAFSVKFCKGARQSDLVSVWQHTLVG